jgi:hypothetical protein
MHKFEMRRTFGVADTVLFAIMILVAIYTLISFTDIIGTYPSRTPQNDGPFYNYYHDKGILIIRTLEFVLCRIFIIAMIFWFIKMTLRKTIILFLLLFPTIIIGLLAWVELGYSSTIKNVGPFDNIFPIFPYHTLVLFAYPVWIFNYSKKQGIDIIIKIGLSSLIAVGIVLFYNQIKFKWGL